MAVLLFTLLILGTVCLVFWNVLLIISNNEHKKEAVRFAERTGKAKFLELYEKFQTDTAVLESTEGFVRIVRKLFHSPKSSEKKAGQVQRKLEGFSKGHTKGINIFVLPGYAFLDMFRVTADKKIFSDVLALYTELNGREYSAHDTRYLLASMVSGALFGVGTTVLLGFLMLASGRSLEGWLLSGLGPVTAIVFAGSLHSRVKGKLKTRRAEIVVDFAQAVSEIALLTSSGMEMFRAWDEVSQGRQGALYREMRHTSAELASGFLPTIAFENFIRRCGTKETSRLGACILQNLTRSNSELSRFLMDCSHDAWEERKHHARRLGAQAQSKLMFPMLLIFIGILIMIGVPAALSMAGSGF